MANGALDFFFCWPKLVKSSFSGGGEFKLKKDSNPRYQRQNMSSGTAGLFCAGVGGDGSKSSQS